MIVLYVVVFLCFSTVCAIIIGKCLKHLGVDDTFGPISYKQINTIAEPMIIAQVYKGLLTDPLILSSYARDGKSIEVIKTNIRARLRELSCDRSNVHAEVVQNLVRLGVYDIIYEHKEK